MEKQSNFIVSAEMLRVIGALVIVCYHFSHIADPVNEHKMLIANEEIRNSLNVGTQGLNLLFIVSGLVIYYTLLKSNYTFSQFPKFLLRRSVRILLPFWATIVLFVAIPLLYDQATFYSIKQVLLNATLTVDLFPNEKWINPVFITLKLEMIFYIAIGLLGVLLRKNIYFMWLLTFLGLICTYFFGDNDFVMKIPFFLIGMNLTYFFVYPVNWRFIPMLLILIGYVGTFYLWQDMVSVLFAIFVLFLIKKPIPGFIQLGSRSYSLYLTHGISIILSATWLFHYGFQWYSILPISLLIGLIFTELFYRLVEKGATNLSKKIR